MHLTKYEYLFYHAFQIGYSNRMFVKDTAYCDAVLFTFDLIV